MNISVAEFVLDYQQGTRFRSDVRNPVGRIAWIESDTARRS